MKRVVALLACLAAFPLAAQEVVTPPAALTLDGVPPVPTEIALKLKPYGEFRPHGLMSWHPLKREMLVRRRLNATSQVHLVSEPLTPPQPVTDLPNAVSSAGYQPVHGKYFVFPMGEGGNEVFRLNRYDIESKTITPLSPDGERASGGAFNRKGDRIVYSTLQVDKNNPERNSSTRLHLVDPLKPQGDKVIARWEKGSWFNFRFSEDGKRLAYVEFLSVNESHLWVMDIATGRKRRVTPATKKGEPVFYGSPQFSKDGRGLFALSDRGSEYKRLTYIPMGRGPEKALTRNSYDVEDFAVSNEANLIAFITNEDGSSVLRFLELPSMKELPRPPLFNGVIGGLEWRGSSSEIGFHVTSARSAGDVFSYDVKGNQLTRWTNGNNPEVNTREFAEPRIIKWLSFDGRQITGLHYHPGEKFTGKRPVIISVHGGPESQARPGFIGRNNYFVNELGIAMIYPNIRGSAGFGKTFLKLDNGRLREDSVKDIGALLDWIKLQPDLDADKVLVTGGSYGGYVTLASAVLLNDRIAGAMSVVGISNFVTFLERTESYRRDLRRAEYGDERDPEMRAFLESISPLAGVEKIAKPLFIAQGRNDPRVPYTESEQMVAALKKRGTPVWFMMAGDEGHGFAKKPNQDYLFGSMVEFAKRTLLQ
ncbi:MAG: prolyl oligopeptidase family serine peptidase [Usitatibacter sp.]